MHDCSGMNGDVALWNAFTRVPRRDQALLRMLTTDPTPSYEQIAAALGVAIGSVWPKRGRALERLAGTRRRRRTAV